jgi:tetratricopeptide (TPR) repeat protein
MDRPEQHSESAEALLQAGRTAEAEAVLRAGLARFPDHEWLATAYGALLNRENRWEEAVEDWRRQVARFPDQAPAHSGLAVALDRLGRRAEAYEVLGEAARRWAAVDWLRVQHAQYAGVALADPRQAAEVWGAVAADFPAMPYPRIEQARALRAAGDARAALGVVQAALQTWPDNAALQVGALENLLDLGDLQQALERWRALRRLEGSEARTIPFDQTWRLFAALDGSPDRAEPLAYLLSEPESGSADWRPVLVERVQVLPSGEFAGRLRADIRNHLREAAPAAPRTLLHRLIWSLVGGELTPADARENLRTALEGSPWLGQVLLENWTHGERTPLYAEAVRDLVPESVRAELGSAHPRYERVLEALKAASAFDPPTFDLLIGECATHFAGAADLARGSPAYAVAETVRAHLQPRRASRAFARPLRIAVCVSGQMRGYRDAFPSWSLLGLQEHDTRYFVHTWKRLGGKPPELSHAYRSFEAGFAQAYTEVVTRLGTDEVARRYPRLFRRATAAGETDVDPEAVQALYGAEAVCIDDEADPPFDGRSNFWKMHYKIRQAHRLAIDGGVDFDLFVRIRPDRAIVSARDLDWSAVAQRCDAENLIYADEGRSVQSLVGYYIGDQFAVGGREAMDAYAGTFDFVEAGGMFGVPPEHVPHASLALRTFHQGVRVERVPGVAFGEHKNASRIGAEEAAALLSADIGARTPDDSDTLLLRSCGAPSG